MKIASTKLNWISNNSDRLDASYHLSDGPRTRILFTKSPYEITTLEKETSNIFKGQIFRRTYVSSPEFGHPFITASDMMKADINSGKYISKKYSNNAEELLLEKGWILVSRSGTLGNIVFTNEDFEGVFGTDDLIRIIPNENKTKRGFLYAFLASKYGYGLLTQASYGGVVKHIEPHHIADIPIPLFPPEKQQHIHELITRAAALRVAGNGLLGEAEELLFRKTGLPRLSANHYEYFGAHSGKRKTSTFRVSRKEINALSVNAFNYSRKIDRISQNVIDTGSHLSLEECLTAEGIFSTGSFKRLEIDSPNAIRLINQSDIFNVRKVGKSLAKLYVRDDKLVEYGEVLIAGVGTLGENETFCRCIFANEELEGQLISGEFIRMNTNEKVPPGYLFTFLSSEYGFRLIRSTQTGTKLCRPIQKLLLTNPVPIIENSIMQEIDHLVKQAHTKRYEALQTEDSAIQEVENEIASWQS